MTSSAVSLTPQLLVRFLRRHLWLWLVPAIAGFVLAAVYSLVTPRKWEATQGFLIRSEAAGFADQRLGKFTDLSEMKAVQETVLEIARSKSVLTAALKRVGPPPSWFTRKNFPTPEEVLELRENMEITPPGGAEFGTSEVFYLTVFNSTPERAMLLAETLAGQLERRLGEVRDERAVSLIAELQNSVNTAHAARDVELNNLAEFESKVGADLAELRALESPLGAQGELAQTVVAIEAALREGNTQFGRNEQLLALLKDSLSSPERLLATPSSLLSSQPALDRLKTGLVNAQINAAALAGTRSEKHPMVIAARNRIAQMREELRKELPVAVTSLEQELKLNQERTEALQGELTAARERFAMLAGKRAEYSNLIATVASHNQLVQVAEDQLADARATQAGAKTASVLSRIDEVEGGLNPVGPGRTTTSIAGGVAGLVLGLGLLFSLRSPAELATPSDVQQGEGPFNAQAGAQSPRPEAWDVWTPAPTGTRYTDPTGSPS